MIVVDADVIAAFWIQTARTPTALRVRRRDADWIAPPLWRSEFRSVLRQYLVAGHMDLGQARWLTQKAEAAMRGQELPVESDDVLKLVEQTDHSSYDCEYVALADARGLQLVTGDARVVALFPGIAVSMEAFADQE